MMIISFAATTPALLAGVKTCTRRNWLPSHARHFQPGGLVAAYNRSPRLHGERVAMIRLGSVEYTARLPLSDYAAEGLEWMEQRGVMIWGLHPRDLWRRWLVEGLPMWVVRFELMAVESPYAAAALGVP